MVASFQCSWKEGEDPMGTLRPQRYGRSPPLPISLQYMPLARKTFVVLHLTTVGTLRPTPTADVPSLTRRMFRKGAPAVTRNPLAHAPSQILRRASHATDRPFDQISTDASTLPNIVFVLLRPLATRSHDPKSGARIRVPTRTESHLPERAEGPARQAPAPPALGQRRWSAKPLLRPPPIAFRGVA